MCFVLISDSDVQLLHNRLGHPSFHYLKHLYPRLFINKNPSCLQCEHCILAKQTRAFYPPGPYKPSHLFHLIHNDVWGPSWVQNFNGERWFVTFIDDHTRVCLVYLIKKKSEVTKIFKHFHKLVTNIFQSSILIFRTNNGKEYYPNELSDIFKKIGLFIKVHVCLPHNKMGLLKERIVTY